MTDDNVVALNTRRSSDLGYQAGGSRQVVNPPGPPHDGGMEERISKLEDDVGEIKAILARLAPRIDEMYGRMQNVPTLMQIGGVVLGINAGIVAVSALLVRVLQQ